MTRRRVVDLAPVPTARFSHGRWWTIGFVVFGLGWLLAIVVFGFVGSLFGRAAAVVGVAAACAAGAWGARMGT